MAHSGLQVLIIGAGTPEACLWAFVVTNAVAGSCGLLLAHGLKSVSLSKICGWHLVTEPIHDLGWNILYCLRKGDSRVIQNPLSRMGNESPLGR